MGKGRQMKNNDEKNYVLPLSVLHATQNLVEYYIKQT